VFGRVPAVAGEVVVPVAEVPAVPLAVPELPDEPGPEVCGLGDNGARLLSLEPELLEPEPEEPLDPDEPDPESELPKGSWYC
jgi:hypothetical protein